MYQSSYFIDKSTHTLADNLAAFGLAYVINAIADGRAAVRIEDRGYCFAISCEPALQAEWVEQREFFVGAPFLITQDSKTQAKMLKGVTIDVKNLPEVGAIVADYEAEKRNNEAFFNWLKALPAEDKKKAVRGDLTAPITPHPDWEIFRVVNPASLQGYNSLIAEWWRGREAFAILLGVLLKMTAQIPNAIDEAERAWLTACKTHGLGKPKDATALQFLNPTQGKGTNSPKTQWSAPGNLKGFWLLEWLKLVGLRYGGITRQIKGCKDRKTYALTPLQLDWNRHNDVMRKFKRSMAGSVSAIQLDVLASLRYTQALLQHFEDAREEDLSLLFGRSAGDLVSGWAMAFYKDLGQVVAPMNIASINLPRWVKPTNRHDLVAFYDTLEEHVRIVRNLDESRGDQFSLLADYRNFLSGNDLTPFFAFTTAYSGFIISQMEKKSYVQLFTINTLEVLFMNSDNEKKTFSQIVQNDGFKNVAAAIRHSTIKPQSAKGRGIKPVVEIRYGLGQQLARKAAYPAEFLAELTEFLHLYNAENSQLREKDRNPFRKDVTTHDIDAITLLVDQYGAKVVCNMLVAYGYANDRKLPTPDEPTQVLEELPDQETGSDGDKESDE